MLLDADVIDPAEIDEWPLVKTKFPFSNFTSNAVSANARFKFESL